MRISKANETCIPLSLELFHSLKAERQKEKGIVLRKDKEEEEDITLKSLVSETCIVLSVEFRRII